MYVNVHVTETLILISMHGGQDFFLFKIKFVNTLYLNINGTLHVCDMV